MRAFPYLMLFKMLTVDDEVVLLHFCLQHRLKPIWVLNMPLKRKGTLTYRTTNHFSLHVSVSLSPDSQTLNSSFISGRLSASSLITCVAPMALSRSLTCVKSDLWKGRQEDQYIWKLKSKNHFNTLRD